MTNTIKLHLQNILIYNTDLVLKPDFDKFWKEQFNEVKPDALDNQQITEVDSDEIKSTNSIPNYI